MRRERPAAGRIHAEPRRRVMTAPPSSGMMPLSAPVVECLGVPITAHTRDSAARHVVHLAGLMREARQGPTDEPGASGSRRGSDVHLTNAYTLALADRDPELCAILRSASLNLPDGQSVAWASQLLHRDDALPGTRVYGPDLLLDVFALSQHTDLRHYLLGSTPDVLEALHRELRRRFPQARITGTCSPPFRPLTARELRQQAEDIRAAEADIVWVGLGTPKQDRWAADLCAELPMVAVAVGAAFDFIAGTKRQAPLWMQHNGLEWLFRLGCEPRRLWRRYVFGNARFLWGVTRQVTINGSAAGPRAVQGPRLRAAGGPTGSGADVSQPDDTVRQASSGVSFHRPRCPRVASPFGRQPAPGDVVSPSPHPQWQRPPRPSQEA
ncbi:WecB/TagA/CpsF family glycosyltransferase [Streptomyces massasporeus]|uniref:WecB/TagA/CpsF family glycosyltransferase n=1 Tax=Streptomyces massasporeus TaxID=67324 RepID=UPI00381464E7